MQLVETIGCSWFSRAPFVSPGSFTSYLFREYSQNNNNTLRSLISLTSIQSLDTDPYLLIPGPHDIPKGQHSRVSQGQSSLCLWRSLNCMCKFSTHMEQACTRICCDVGDSLFCQSFHLDRVCKDFSSGFYLIPVLDANKVNGFTCDFSKATIIRNGRNRWNLI